MHGLIVEERTTIGGGQEWTAMEKRGRAREKKMVETEVGDRGEGLAESDDGSADSNDGSSENVIPVVD